ncbi:MAG: hypothetical protein IT393_10700 [Nitrospirae bacterium]|nr:hypothetical protein [Nitrospirota bacterium]
MNQQNAFTISDFCESHKISRAFFYQLVKAGKGPLIIRLGSKRLVTKEAAAEWRRKLEAESGAGR